MSLPQEISSTIAQQIIFTSAGVASGLAGFVLADRLKNQPTVPTGSVFVASTLMIISTFAGVFVINQAIQNRSSQDGQNVPLTVKNVN